MIDLGISAAKVPDGTSVSNSESAIKRAWRAFVELGPARRATAIALASFVMVGLWLRARGMLFATAPFWLDESMWTLALADGEPYHAMRPLGFMAASELLAKAFSWREFGLRFLPWLSGLLAVGVAVPIAFNLFKTTAARLLFVAAITLNPGAIDLAKEFKPYSVSLLIHECGALLAILYWNSRRERWLWLAGLWGLVSVLFAQDAVFAYPAVFGVMGLRAFRDGSRRERVLVIVGGLLTLLLVAALYFLLWRHLGAGPEGDASNYWGRRYGVFYRGEGSRWAWLFAKQSEIAGFPGMRRETWAAAHPLLARVDASVWGVLHLAGLATLLLQKRLSHALLLLTPLVVTLAFNALGFWPYGAFRTNLFLLFYAAAIAATALDWERPTWQPVWAVAGLSLTLAPIVAFERDFHEHKGSSGFVVHSVMPQALDLLLSQPGRDPRRFTEEVLVMDRATANVFDYYMRLQPDYRERAEAIRSRFRIESGKKPLLLARRYVETGAQVWALYQHQNPRLLDRKLAGNRLRAAQEHTIDGDAALLLRLQARSPRRR